MTLKVNEIANIKEIAEQLQKICKFGAFEYINNKLSINDKCRMCMQCTKEGPQGAITTIDETEEIPKTVLDKSRWKGICVIAEVQKGRISGATIELLSKARELSLATGHTIQAVVLGHELQKPVEELSYYADEVYVYDFPELKDFLPEPYAAALCNFIISYMPSTILIAGTNNGRSLAPKVAARFRTGLTADCTKLTMNENTDLVQIRPAFGGNIMAEILTSNSRPQICTVRPGIFAANEPDMLHKAKIIYPKINVSELSTKCKILKIEKKPEYIDIADAQVIVAAGRGIRNQAGLDLVEELAKLLGAQTACTRPMVENGLFNPRRQIGLSGRTVRPKLIITCGISGSVQFAAGMSGSDRIIAINNDPNARIFSIANYSVIGDVYEVLPRMISLIKGETQ